MAVYQAAVTKYKSWRGSNENFSNIYTVKHSNPGEADFQQLIGALVNGEKDIFANDTTFVSGRVWGPLEFNGDGISEKPIKEVSVTQYLADFSGNGLNVGGASMYTELAVMLSAYIGRAPGTGRKRFLRKYYHTTFGQSFPTPATLSGAEMDTTMQGNIRTKFVDEVVIPIEALGWNHCAMNGDTPTQPWTVNRRLRIRQLRN